MNQAEERGEISPSSPGAGGLAAAQVLGGDQRHAADTPGIASSAERFPLAGQTTRSLRRGPWHAQDSQSPRERLLLGWGAGLASAPDEVS